MKHVREKLMSHILMVVAPLLVLLMITVAWFISSRTINLSEMSFAAQDSGPGAVLYKSTAITDRIYASGSTPTLTNTVTWGKQELPEDSDITIKNMVPGQVEYYLLVSKSKFSVRLLNVEWYADGGSINLGTGAELPMAQCVGLYLLPVTDLPDPVEGSSSIPKITLERDVAVPPAIGQLTAAYLKGEAPGETDPLPVVGATENNPNYHDAYILAVYCDPLYLQGKDTDGKPIHSPHLAGTLSFSLAFDKEEEP